jgi:hypothetical protein
MISEARIGQLIREEGYPARCSARRPGDPMIVSMKVDDTWIDLGTREDIKRMTVRQLRTLIFRKTVEAVYDRDASTYERGYCGIH